jgi:hypothetical protein
MTSHSKTCQISVVGLMMEEGYWHMLGEEPETAAIGKRGQCFEDWPDSLLIINELFGVQTDLEFLPCDCKAKHLMTIRASEFGNRAKSKFRLCTFHFDYLLKDYQDNAASRARPFCKFRRDRL